MGRPFPAGALWREVDEKSASARDAGALETIPTRWYTLTEAGIPFVVRVLERLQNKPRANQDAAPRDPFEPYDEALYVADAGPDHVLLLNKFNVVEQHLLLVTRHFEEQRTLIREADFVALARCLDEAPALAFYNGGLLAGASQPHRHLQLVPLPVGLRREQLPIEGLMERVPAAGAPIDPAPLPYLHAARALSFEEARDGAALARIYLELLDALAADPRSAEAREVEARLPPAGERPQPFAYNLLVTQHWMTIVPRRSAGFEGIDFNALGYAGALLVKSDEDREKLQRLGPLRFLAGAAVARE